MEKKYLIVKCEELGDQWECDADRQPITIVEDWEQWYIKNQPNYTFEVYKLNKKNTFSLIKEYYKHLGKGMALYYWDLEEQEPENNKPTLIYKYKNKTRDNKVPKDVEEYIKKGHNVDNDLQNCGYITFELNEKYYVYGEYHDDSYSLGY